MSGRRQLEGVEGIPHHELVPTACQRACRLDHFRNHGMLIEKVTIIQLQPAYMHGFPQAQVHEIGYTECAKSYVFWGSKDYSAKQVQEMLGLLAPNLRAAAPQQPTRPNPANSPAARFLLPVQQADYQITNVLEQLQQDPWPVANDRRPLRCTGVALSVAIGLMETSFQGAGGRVMLFTSGPASEGPGLVVGPQLKEPIRSHHDIDRDNIKYFKKAVKV